MSCRIAYLLREEDRSLWFAQGKHGHAIEDGADRDRMLARLRRDRISVESGHLPDGCINDFFCKGVLFDFFARCYRYYPCYGEPTPLDHLDQAIRSSHLWEGWDAGIAMGGREDLSELMPAAARIIQPYAVLDRAQEAMGLLRRDDWFVDWDPVGFVLRVREHALWVSITQGFDAVTIIEPSGTALDFRLHTPDTHPVHPILACLRKGPDTLGAVRTAPPYPPPSEDEIVENSVVVDHPRSIIHYSPTAVAPARLLDAVRAAWPGWRLQILPSHQQVTAMPDGTPVVRPRLAVIPLPP